MCPHAGARGQLSAIRLAFVPIACSGTPASGCPHRLLGNGERARRSVAKSCFHDVDGIRMHARVAGQGPDVVLVHGVVASHRYWEPTLRLLGRQCRAWAPDLPGYGRSGKIGPLGVDELARWLARWMDAAGIDRAHVMGNSAGCQVAAALAQNHPERVDRLVLHAPSMDPTAPTLARQTLRWTQAMLQEPRRPWLKAVKDVRDMGLTRAVKQMESALADRIEARLPHIQCPTLVVRGVRDKLVPGRWAEEATKLLPHGRLVVVSGAHIINETQPQVLVDAVSHFLGLPDAPGEPTKAKATSGR